MAAQILQFPDRHSALAGSNLQRLAERAAALSGASVTTQPTALRNELCSSPHAERACRAMNSHLDDLEARGEISRLALVAQMIVGLTKDTCGGQLACG